MRTVAMLCRAWCCCDSCNTQITVCWTSYHGDTAVSKSLTASLGPVGTSACGRTVEQWIQIIRFIADVGLPKTAVVCASISGVYAFGFLFMLPQLYINYMVAMKSCHFTSELNWSISSVVVLMLVNRHVINRLMCPVRRSPMLRARFNVNWSSSLYVIVHIRLSMSVSVVNYYSAISCIVSIMLKTLISGEQCHL